VLGYFRNLKELAVSIKESTMKGQFYGQLFDFSKQWLYTRTGYFDSF
jgi:hypothetical protein